MELHETTRDAEETTEWTEGGIAITRRPGRCGGEPTIAGSRITIAHVIALARRFDWDLSAIHARGLPHRTLAEIEGAVQYYREHSEEIDGYIEDEKEARRGLPLAPMGR